MPHSNAQRGVHTASEVLTAVPGRDPETLQTEHVPSNILANEHYADQLVERMRWALFDARAGDPRLNDRRPRGRANRLRTGEAPAMAPGEPVPPGSHDAWLSRPRPRVHDTTTDELQARDM